MRIRMDTTHTYSDSCGFMNTTLNYSWSLTLKKRHSLMVTDRKILRKMV